MGIEKMAFVDIGGDIERLDDTLRICLASEMFHPEYAAKLSEYSVGSPLLVRNPFGVLLTMISDVAAQLRISLSYRDYSTMNESHDEFIDSTNEYLRGLRESYPAFFEDRRKIQDEIASYTSALDILEETDISEIQSGEEAGRLLLSMGFDGIGENDYSQYSPAEAIARIKKTLEGERARLERSITDTDRLIGDEKERFLSTYSHIKFLHDAYDLRKYAVGMRGRFHLIGFVRERDREAFSRLFRNISGLTVNCSDAGKLERLPVPVKLRNNWFVKPFEMFVNMYGAPSYHDVDPSPFLAYTYTLLFGVMFGDLGQGLCVVLLGLFLWKTRRMELGAIMSRIGISSMIAGFCYGSVFGYENLLDPFFINVMGLPGKPIEVLHPETTSIILLAAVGAGAVCIISAIIFNIFIGLRRRDYDRAILSSNGLCGFVFFTSVLVGAISVITGNSIMSLPYILFLIALPLLIIFFREPIAHYVRFVNKDTIISHDVELKDNALLTGGEAHIPELFSSPFMTARFGRIPTDSYHKLEFYTNEPFLLYPVKTDQEYIWLIYAMAIVDKAEIDAIFHDLYFERIYIPEDDLKTEEDAVEFIRVCVEAGAPPDTGTAGVDDPPPAPRRRKTIYQRMFPEGFGGFFTETLFEMLEIILSFISNTMSFLRVGGFVLVHAGMMSVVFTLSRMAGSGASAAIIIIGNIFVMVLEGLIVGIQVLRLEFYEMFSRFYGEAGDSFNPVIPKYGEAALK